MSLRSKIEIRQAELQDVKEIADIYNHAISERIATFESEPRSEKAIREWLRVHDTNHPVLVVLLNNNHEQTDSKFSGRVVAWASVSSYRPRACYSGIGEFSIYVKEGFRGSGIGKKLLDELIEKSKELGYWKLLSRIFTFNVASRELCKKCGFREVGVYEKHGRLDGKWIDTVIVERLIPENIN